MIEPETFVAMVRNSSSDYNRFEFIKQQYSLVKGLDKSTIIRVAKTNSDHYMMETLKFFKAYFTYSDVPDLMKTTSSEYYKSEIMRMFSYGPNSKTIVLVIIRGFPEDHYRMEAIKYFKAWFGPTDVIELMNLFSGGHYRMELVKLFKSDFGATSKADVLRIVGNLIDDSKKEEGVKFFAQWFRSDDVSALLRLYTGESYKKKVLDSNNLKGLYNTPESLAELVALFGEDREKYAALEKKVKDGITLSKEMINIIESFKNDKYRKKICILLFAADTKHVFDANCCSSTMALFTVPQRMTLLTEYLKNHNLLPEHIVLLIKQLESKGNATKFLADNGVVDANAKLVEAGYKTAASEAATVDEEESESEPEDEPELELEDDSDDGENVILLKGLKSMYIDQDIKYDIKRDKVIFGDWDFGGSIHIGGVDVGEEARRQGKKIAKKRKEKRKEKKRFEEEKKKKKEQLKVPHAWKDQKVDDKTAEDDICVVCQEKKRMIVLNCGHYHTCGHCTRVQLRGNKQCPVCRAVITTVIRTFA